jgi:hypothetical protein
MGNECDIGLKLLTSGNELVSTNTKNRSKKREAKVESWSLGREVSKQVSMFSYKSEEL